LRRNEAKLPSIVLECNTKSTLLARGGHCSKYVSSLVLVFPINHGMILVQGLRGVESNYELTLLGEIVRRKPACGTPSCDDESLLIDGL